MVIDFLRRHLLHILLGGALVTASAATSAVVLPAVLDGPVTANMVIEEFADYEPPDRLQITRQDYLTSTGSPSDKPTDWPTWQNDMQHRAYFYGAGKVQGGSTYFQEIYVVMSKEPISNYFEFTYRADKDRQYGYIRADFSAGLDVMRYDKEWTMLAGSHISFAEGKNPPSVGIASLPHFADFPGNRNRSYFDFDFYYQCCGDLEIEGLRNITEVPYPYILTCTDENGHGGGSQSGSSSSGSSGGGSSSGGDGSGGSSGGGSSGGGSESSKEEWEKDGEYPWQSSEYEESWEPSLPPFTGGGNEGDTGERGDTWELPEWEVPTGPPITDKDAKIPEFPVDLEEKYPEFPVDLEEKYPEFPVDLEKKIPEFPVDLEEKYPEFPVDLEQSSPDFPVDLEQSYPDPYIPEGWTWPPPFPGG